MRGLFGEANFRRESTIVLAYRAIVSFMAGMSICKVKGAEKEGRKKEEDDTAGYGGPPRR